ncbi:MAG: phage-associated protein [Bacteroidetes bacterium]|nr:phage-associated protein [Bacteroidota bacterium]
MYPAIAIAFEFVRKGIEDKNPVTQMKLQKLVYFAHGIHLAQYNSPLINEKFQAWEYGPVVPEIYASYKIYGSDPIVDTDHLFLFLSEGQKKELEKNSLSRDARSAIDLTWETLKDIDAITLSAWTHKDGSPWKLHYKNGTMPNEEIGEYFLQQFKSASVSK